MKNSMPIRGISGSEELPALRRHRICCQARGQQWQVRGHRVYPIEVSGLRGKWTEKLNSTYNCGLTARPVVLARTYEPGSITYRPEVMVRARRPYPPINPGLPSKKRPPAECRNAP
jgi:hypothetical protein